MARSRAEKAETHARIVEIAARRFRELGIHEIGVADLMDEAGLTVGGFYKHFAARDDLVAEAVAAATWATWNPSSYENAIRQYLSEEHRDNPGTGCVMGALSGDITRGSDAVRAVYTNRVKRTLKFFDGLSTKANASDRRDSAMLTFSALVGAINLSRAVDDPKLSRQILKAVTKLLTAPSPKAPSAKKKRRPRKA
jgi:TetR/AcrR family transcriptional repressor of nem operon